MTETPDDFALKMVSSPHSNNMKLKETATLVISGLLLVHPAELRAGGGTNTTREIGSYSVKTFSSGEIGTDSHISGFEVTQGGEVVLFKRNTSATSDILVGEDSLRIEGGCLFLCYGEVGDGLDDAYIHAVKLCGNETDTFTAVVRDDEGVPVLKMGQIPEGWDARSTEEAIQKTFDGIYAKQ